jgi:hypothetical protein
MTFRNISEVLARLDGDTLEQVRSAVEDEIRNRDFPEALNELGTEWPEPLLGYGEEKAISEYHRSGFAAFTEMLLRGRENG